MLDESFPKRLFLLCSKDFPEICLKKKRRERENSFNTLCFSDNQVLFNDTDI